MTSIDCLREHLVDIQEVHRRSVVSGRRSHQGILRLLLRSRDDDDDRFHNVDHQVGYSSSASATTKLKKPPGKSEIFLILTYFSNFKAEYATLNMIIYEYSTVN